MAKIVLDNNQQVAHYFANNVQAEGRGSNFYFENGMLYSYGRHFAVARRLPSGVFVMTTRTYGNSTAKHLNYTRAALRGSTVVYCNDPSDTAATNRREANAAILAKLDEAATIRRIRVETREAHRVAALNIAETFNAYLAALPVEESEGVPPFNLDEFETMRAARDAQRERDEAAKKAEQERRAAMQRDTLAAWLAGGPNNGGMHALPVALRLAKSSGSHHTGGLLPDSGSVGRDVIQTSHGAEIPVAHGVALWPIVQSVVRGERTPDEAARLVSRLGVYTLTTIRADGGIRVGCHEIAYSELARMAVLLGLPHDASTEPATRPAIGYKKVAIADTAYQTRRAQWDGMPKRPPRKGELYLSGAVVAAYRAKADMTESYFIANEVQA